MANQPQVRVTDISNLQGSSLPHNLEIKLGDVIIDAKFNTLLDQVRDSSNHAYVLRWTGDKIPRGAIIGDEEIAWTQNGIVNNESGKMIGTYDRVVEFGGDEKRDHVMIVYIR